MLGKFMLQATGVIVVSIKIISKYEIFIFTQKSQYVYVFRSKSFEMCAFKILPHYSFALFKNLNIAVRLHRLAQIFVLTFR